MWFQASESPEHPGRFNRRVDVDPLVIDLRPEGAGDASSPKELFNLLSIGAGTAAGVPARTHPNAGQYSDTLR